MTAPRNPLDSLPGWPRSIRRTFNRFERNREYTRACSFMAGMRRVDVSALTAPAAPIDTQVPSRVAGSAATAARGVPGSIGSHCDQQPARRGRAAGPGPPARARRGMPPGFLPDRMTGPASAATRAETEWRRR